MPFLNPLDRPFEERIKALTPPQNEGEKFHGFMEVSFDKILEIFQGKILNDVRDELDESKVEKFTAAALDGKWSDAFDAPRLTVPGREYDMSDWSVNELTPEQVFYLVTGEHRCTGVKKANRNKLIFAIVSYENEYWKVINQSTENIDDLEYIKAKRTDKQILMAAEKAIKAGKLDINDDDQLNKLLKDLQTPVGQRETWREAIRTEHSGLVPIRTWIDSARKEWIKENIDSEIEFSSKGDKKTWNIQGEDNKVSICKTFKGGSGKGGLDDSDYDVRLAKEAFGYLLDEGVGKVDIYSSYKNHKGDTQRLKEFRKRKEALLKNELEFYRKVVKAADDGVFDLDTDVTWKHLPQTNEEMEQGGTF
tara:strand:+ start:70 stop:1161 length:1092 start_codon:yes stop_codon:yes gene_type:complete